VGNSVASRVRNYLTADLGNYLALEGLRLGRYLVVDTCGHLKVSTSHLI